MRKDQPHRTSGPESTNGPPGPKSSRDPREKSPRGAFLGRPGDLVIGPEKQFLKLGSACREMLLFYMQNNCHVSKLETCCYWRYKELYVTGKVSERSRNGPQLAVSCEHINIFIKHLVVSWSLRNCVQIMPFFKFKLRSFQINVSIFFPYINASNVNSPFDVKKTGLASRNVVLPLKTIFLRGIVHCCSTYISRALGC